MAGISDENLAKLRAWVDSHKHRVDAGPIGELIDKLDEQTRLARVRLKHRRIAERRLLVTQKHVERLQGMVAREALRKMEVDGTRIAAYGFDFADGKDETAVSVMQGKELKFCGTLEEFAGWAKQFFRPDGSMSIIRGAGEGHQKPVTDEEIEFVRKFLASGGSISNGVAGS